MNYTPSDLWQNTGTALVPFMTRLRRGSSRFVPGGWIALSGEPMPQYNLAFIGDDSDTDAVLATCGALAADRSVPMVVFTTPAVGTGLAHRKWPGLSPAGTMPLMSLSGLALDQLGPQDPAFDVVVVASPSELDTSVDIQAEAFGAPKEVMARVNRPILDDSVCELFLAVRDGQAYATVMSAAADGMVSFWSMATRPALRRQGAGRALLTGAVEHHRRLGSEYFYLGSSEEGRRLYGGMGFVEREQTPMWTLSPPSV